MSTFGGPLSGGGGVTEIAWGEYLTIADLDSAGAADSDPGSILVSLTEPVAGELLFSVAPDGTARDGVNEGVRFDITSAVNGFWDASQMAADGRGCLAVEVTYLAVSDTSVQAMAGFGLRETDAGEPLDTLAVGVRAWTSFSSVLVNSAQETSGGTGSVASGCKALGLLIPCVDTTGGGTGSMLGSAFGLDASGNQLSGVSANVSTWEGDDLKAPSSWTAYAFVCNNVVTATAFTIRVKIRIGYVQWRPSP